MPVSRMPFGPGSRGRSSSKAPVGPACPEIEVPFASLRARSVVRGSVVPVMTTLPRLIVWPSFGALRAKAGGSVSRTNGTLSDASDSIPASTIVAVK